MGDWGAPLSGVYETPGQATVAAGGAANTKGAWTQLIATTSRAASCFLLSLLTNWTNQVFLIDIGIGAAGAETVLLSNASFEAATGGAHRTPIFLIPVAIPAGTRVSARCQANAANAAVTVLVSVLEFGFPRLPSFGRATTYGAIPASSLGTAVALGASGVNGAWTQIVASLTNPLRWLVIFAERQAAANNSSNTLDIGVGAVGSEQVVIPTLSWRSDNDTGNSYGAGWSLPVSIPAGQRVAARGSSSPVGGDTVDVVLVGIG